MNEKHNSHYYIYNRVKRKLAKILIVLPRTDSFLHLILLNEF